MPEKEDTKESVPRKDIITEEEREHEFLGSIPGTFRKPLEKLIQEYRDVFPAKLPKGAPPIREVRHHVEMEPAEGPHIDLLSDWVLLSRMS